MKGADTHSSPSGFTVRLEASRSDRPRYGEFFHSLAKLFFQRQLLFCVKTKTEDPELDQGPLREMDLLKLKTDLLLYFSALLRGQLKLYEIFHFGRPP
jgi:hypothetical protein